MALQEILRPIAENLHDSATVKKVYGEPFTADGKTIIPVARVKYGFCGHGGRNKEEKAEKGNSAQTTEGGCACGRVEVIPLGYIEIAGKSSEFIPIKHKSKMSSFLVGGMAFCLFAGIFLKRKKWFR